MFESACKYEGWFKITQMRIVLLSLADPGFLTKAIQDRAIASIRDTNPSRAFITLDSAHHTFTLSHDSEVTYHTFIVRNLTAKRIKVTAVIDSLTLSCQDYSLGVVPDTFTIPKNGEVTVTAVLKCLKLPPSSDASALFHFLVQPSHSVSNVSALSRYFVMLDVVPPCDTQEEEASVKDLSQVVHNQYKSAKQSIGVLKTFIPASLLHIFAVNPEPPRSSYCETFKAAVIFLDVSGFTMLTAQMALLGDVGPEMISSHLNNYFGALIEAAARFGGELVKSAGDAIMCIFREQPGENLELTDLAVRSVQCGLEIQHSHSVYDSGQGFTLSLHIGIGVGHMSLMFVGGVNNQWMHIVAGDPLAQLSSCVDGSDSGEVVVSKECYHLMQDKVEGIPRNEDFLITSFILGFDPPEVALAVPKVPLAAEAALRCFIHPAILPSLKNNEWQLDELRNLTSIFVKIVTDNFHDDDPSQYCASLQEAFSCMQACIIQHEGLVCQFLQDDKGVIFFGAFGVPPYSHADDPLRAVRAGVDIFNGLAAVGIPCAVGIYTGFVFTGLVGSPTRHDYTVLGDAVNMAARLMGKAYQLGLGVLCGKHTYDFCSLRFQFEVLDPVKVKGKDELIHIYRPQLSTCERKAIFEPTAQNIFGRQDEKLLLSTYLTEMKKYWLPGPSAFQANRQDQLARTVILEGPPGIGKSFLAQYVYRVAKQLEFLVANGDCKAIHQITPYYTWRGVLETLFDVEHSESSEIDKSFVRELQRTLEPRLMPYLPLLQTIFPQLTFSHSEMKPVEQLRKEEKHSLINELIKCVIEHKSCQVPLVIVLDDLQWMDAPSLRVFTAMASTMHSILIIATTRDLTDSLRRQLAIFSPERTDHIILEPLNDEDSTKVFLKNVRFVRFVCGVSNQF